MTESSRPNGHRYAAMRRVTVVGALVNLLLSGVKLILGYLGQSQALIADGIHSLSDLLTDALVLVAAKHGSRAADEDHPYGHARIETAAAVALGVFLIAVGAGIAWDAARRLVTPDLLWQPGWLAMAGAILSIASKEGLYHYTVVVARRIRSELLRANAWHHRSDAVSSLVVVVGLTGSMLGMAYLDALAAIGVALMVGKVGWDLARRGTRELVDTGLEPEKLSAIREAILGVDGVQALHMLKTRRMGSDALVDVHIILADPRLSVSEGHQISETVRGRLMARFEDIRQVMVHIDPEDDELVAPNRDLPLRPEVMARLESLWAPTGAARHVHRVNLHYINGRLHLELFVPFSALAEGQPPEALAEALVRASRQDKDVADVKVFFG